MIRVIISPHPPPPPPATKVRIVLTQPQPQPQPQKLRVIVTDKNRLTSKTLLDQTEPVPIDHEEVDLPTKLTLSQLYYQNQNFWIDWPSGYIFLPDDIQSNKFEPIGRFIKQPDTQPDHGLLHGHHIDWYFRYDTDVVIETASIKFDVV
jgi:hypothetical protein